MPRYFQPLAASPSAARAAVRAKLSEIRSKEPAGCHQRGPTQRHDPEARAIGAQRGRRATVVMNDATGSQRYKVERVEPKMAMERYYAQTTAHTDGQQITVMRRNHPS